MAGKPNDKMFKTMISKHGSEEAAREWFRRIGKIGGSRGHTGGFAANPALARVAGARGGRISSNSKDKDSLEVRRKRYAKTI